MESEERDSLLWRLSEEQDSETAESVDPEPVSDETLESYHRGELDLAAAEALEQRLMTDPNCRRRLAELAGVSMPPAPAELRQQLVERFAQPAESQSSRTSRSASWWGWWRGWQPKVAFAMVVTLAIGGAFWLRVQNLGMGTELPVYEVSVQGLSARRGAPPTTAEPTIEAYADTPVVIDAVVTERAVRGVQVALYRVDGDHLERIEEGVRRTSRPGAVRFEVNASTLVGSVEATHTVFLVIGWEPLPEALPRPADAGSTPFFSRGYRFHRLLLRLVKPNPAAGPASGRLPSDDEENTDVKRSTIEPILADSVLANHP